MPITGDHSETALMLNGYGLTTAEIFDHMPDYRNVLNTFVCQCVRAHWPTVLQGAHSLRTTIAHHYRVTPSAPSPQPPPPPAPPCRNTTAGWCGRLAPLA